MWYPNGQSRRLTQAVLMGGIVWSFASNVQAETEYWYYNGELTTPADSRAVLSPYRLPAGQVPKAFAKPKPGGWDWQKRKQVYLSMRPESEVPVSVAPSPARAYQARIIRVGGISPPAQAERSNVSRALPFWPDLPVRKVR